MYSRPSTVTGLCVSHTAHRRVLARRSERSDSEILYTAQNTEIWLPRMRTKYFRFSVKNELGLENYLGYQCTKFGENW